MATLLFQLLLVASATTVSGQQAINYAKDATDGDGNPLILVSDSYSSGQLGEAVLTILPGEADVQKSNYDWRSCQIKNIGAKRIAAVFIDVGSSIFSDMVFDPDGSGGDDVAKKLEHNWGTTETNPISVDEYQWTWEPAHSGVDSAAPFNPADLSTVNNLFVDELSDSGLGSGGGFRGALILFKDFDAGETYEFSADMDPNSIAGLQQGTASVDAEWDVGGVSGAELIGSVVTVLFGDGTTASGTIAGDGSQAGGVAVISSSLMNPPSLTVGGSMGPGSSGLYTTYPSVVVSSAVGSKVRVTMIRAFDPVDNQTPLANGKITAESLVAARLEAQYPEFPVNNARSLQHVEATIPASGSVDVTGMFEFVGQDALGFTAVVLDAAGIPTSTTSDPIRLVYKGAKITCPDGQKLDGSAYCVENWCNEDIQCPANSVRREGRECYNTFNDCQCLDGFLTSNGQCYEKGVCPSGQKPDGNGYCVRTWCNANYQCPANSKRKESRQCYNNFDDCLCLDGLYRSSGKCLECPSGDKKDGSGYCVRASCNADYQCPNGRKPNRRCYDTKNDCL